MRRSLIFALTVLFVFASYAFGQKRASSPARCDPFADFGEGDVRCPVYTNARVLRVRSHLTSRELRHADALLTQNAPPPPLPPAAQAEPESIALSAEEMKQRAALGEEEQKAGRKLQAAYESIRSAATDAEIIAAVNAFQAGLYLRAEFERKFREWQDAAKAAHACAECQFDAQFTKLVKPQPNKKEEKK